MTDAVENLEVSGSADEERERARLWFLKHKKTEFTELEESQLHIVGELLFAYSKVDRALLTKADPQFAKQFSPGYLMDAAEQFSRSVFTSNAHLLRIAMDVALFSRLVSSGIESNYKPSSVGNGSLVSSFVGRLSLISTVIATPFALSWFVDASTKGQYASAGFVGLLFMFGYWMLWRTLQSDRKRSPETIGSQLVLKWNHLLFESWRGSPLLVELLHLKTQGATVPPVLFVLANRFSRLECPA